METYLIMRRNGWRTADELQDAPNARRSRAKTSPTTSAGSGATSSRRPMDPSAPPASTRPQSPEAIRRHAYAATLPVDEIVAVADTVAVRPDLQPAAS